MATTRETFGSTLAVVTTTASAVVSLLDNVNAGLSMLSVSIQDAKHEQLHRSLVSREDIEQAIEDEAAQAIVLRDEKTAEFLNNDFRKQHYAAAMERIKARVASAKK